MSILKVTTGLSVRSVMRTLADPAQDRETTLLFHAEVDDRDDQPTPSISSEDSTVYSTFLSSRPGRHGFWDIVSWVSILLLGAGGSMWCGLSGVF